MAKTHKLKNKFWIVEILKGIEAGNQEVTTYHLLRTVESAGYLLAVSKKVTAGPGKPKKFYELSGKGRGYLALSKNWKRPEGMIVRASETYPKAA